MGLAEGGDEGLEGVEVAGAGVVEDVGEFGGVRHWERWDWGGVCGCGCGRHYGWIVLMGTRTEDLLKVQYHEYIVIARQRRELTSWGT